MNPAPTPAHTSETPRSDALISLAESHGDKAVELLSLGLRQLEAELITARQNEASAWASRDKFKDFTALLAALEAQELYITMSREPGLPSPEDPRYTPFIGEAYPGQWATIRWQRFGEKVEALRTTALAAAKAQG